MKSERGPVFSLKMARTRDRSKDGRAQRVQTDLSRSATLDTYILVASILSRSILSILQATMREYNHKLKIFVSGSSPASL